MTRRNQYGPRKTNEEVFVENSTYARHSLKNRIIKEKLLPYECDECGLGDEWNGKKLVLQLEHKNGVSNDHRIENLCFICPNCHTQTSSYAARNRKNPNRTPKKYIDANGVLRNI